MNTRSFNPITNASKYNKTKKTYTKKASHFFIGTKNLPITNIIKILRKKFPQYNRQKIDADNNNTNIIYLDDLFLFKTKIQKNNTQLDLQTSAINTPRSEINNVILYSFYIMSKYMFEETNKTQTSLLQMIQFLKFQIGKDIQRQIIHINGVEYNQSYFSNDDNYKSADQLCQLVLNEYSKYNTIVNYDTINKILLMTCQNTFTFISDLIVIKINDILSPELCSVFRPDKSISLTFSKYKQLMEFNFSCKLIISQGGEPMNPEYPCGYVSFIFYVDFLKNSFGFSKFELSYDLTKCGPEKELDNSTDIVPNNTSKLNMKYIIPAAIGVASIIATPFAIAALGGKKRRNNKTKNNKTRRKNIRRKKSIRKRI